MTPVTPVTPVTPAKSADRPIIGWREWLALPDLDIHHMKVKVDTGARSSSLHAFDIEVFRRAGVAMVRFKVHPLQRDASMTVIAEAEMVEQRWVKSSGGHETLRPVIRTTARLLGQIWPIEVTLVRRDQMGFRMLLGRQALRQRFVVDPSRSYVGGRGPTKRRKRKGGKLSRKRRRSQGTTD